MLLWLVVAAVSVWILQTVLGLWQFKKFSNHVRDLRSFGRVAIGRAKGGFMSGVIVLLVIDDYCRIIKGQRRTLQESQHRLSEICCGYECQAGLRQLPDNAG